MSIFPILQIVVSGLLVVAVLLQSQHGGLSKSWGGGRYHAKRGLERILFYATIVLGIALAVLALLDAVN